VNLDLAILVITCAVNLTLGSFILARNARSGTSRAFAVMSYSICLWTISNFFTNEASFGLSVNNFANRVAYITGYLIVLSGLVFTYFFPVRRSLRTAEKYFIAISSIVALTLAATTYVAGQVSVEHGKLAFSIGPVLWLYVILFILPIILLTKNLLTNRYTSKIAKMQARLVMLAFSITATLGLVINVLVPALGANWQSTRVGPLITMLLVAIITYSIIRHRLFDLRFFVIRATGYTFSVGLITVFYLAPTVWLVTRIMHTHVTQRQFIELVAISLALIIAYRYVRRLFDRLTSKIFFRNLYNPQDVLDQLSDLLVRSVDVAHLRAGSKKVLLQVLKTRSLDYWLEADGDKKMLNLLRRPFEHTTDNVVVTDELQSDQALLQALREEDIAVVVRLRTTHGELGYVTLGFKESGQPYSVQDKQLLSIAADEIAISMQNALHFEEIQNFNKTLQQRVQKATRELSQTNDKLKALDETKDEFITMASHQLRTPLTSVKGYLSMVLEGDAGALNANQKKLLSQSFISAQRMVYLIADLLNLSRLNTGKFVIELSPVNLADTVQAEIDQLRETAQSRGLSLNYKKPSNFPTVMLDETKIHQVIMNFIDNAIYYTPTGGTIDVELKETETAVEYLVKDTGIGVPKTEQHKLFTKFYRANNAKRARPDGTGLGLFMAKKVIVAQGGAIIFQSEEGKGSTFGFRFSKAHHLAPAAKSQA